MCLLLMFVCVCSSCALRVCISQSVESDVETKRIELVAACKELDDLQMKVRALQLVANGLQDYLQNLPSLFVSHAHHTPCDSVRFLVFRNVHVYVVFFSANHN